MPLLRRSCLVAALLALGPFAALAQRLPQDVTPQHYTLALAPDLKTATFTGDETIDVTLAHPTNAITLNAAQIDFKSVTVKDMEGTQPAKVSEDKDKQQVTFTVAKQLPAGAAVLHIRYTGILNGMLRGFYLSKTKRRNYAVTQFEPTDARRAFPSFDEPAFKATFNVSLTINKGDTAISNTNIVSDQPGPGADKHTLHFATTPKMSTYLVAFLVGDFQCQKGESDGVPIRACATPDKVQYAGYALKAAEFVLHYYDNYFGIKYPLPKLDLIAIPDFEAGAMENFGAITYRETDFLLDEKHASIPARERVAQVVAHEMAHQWFGDMVTMQWWNNIWLNEGFADWMENKPVAAWRPEWHVPQQVSEELDNTLNLDAQAVTRTIRAEANTPDQINEMFDGITYAKGASVIHMIESYLGEEQFRKGVHNYLEAHMFGNATAEDFWNAQAKTSGKPVDKIMPTFIEQPGVPLLKFSQTSGKQVEVAQSRFFLNPNNKSSGHQTWTIPVCIRTQPQSRPVKAGTSDCPLLTQTEQKLTLKSGSDNFFYANAGAAGYYRTAYPEPVVENLIAHVEAGLSPRERILFIGDQWAQVRHGNAKVGVVLDLAQATRADPSSQVLATSIGNIKAISDRMASTPEEKKALADWVVKTYKPELQKLGMPSSGEAPDKQVQRTELFGLVGGIGKDPQTIAEAREITDKYLQNPDSVDPTLEPAAIFVAVENGDAKLFDQLQKRYETDNDPQRSEQALALLAHFEQPALIQRALAFAASGKVKNQDSLFIFAGALRDPDTHEVAWKYIQAHWPAVSAQLTEMNGGRIVSAAGSFCSDEKAQEVKQFFTTHKVHASARALGRAESQMHDCVELRSAQEGNLKSWLAAHLQ